MKRYIVSGGGTGGHVYPALAVIEALRQSEEKPEILYVGNPASLEEEAAKSRRIPFYAISVRPFNGEGLGGKVKGLFFMAMGSLRALGLVFRRRPDAVLGTGGYCTGPLLLVSRLLRIPYYLHEQNVVPGLANRTFSKGAKKIFISFSESRHHFGVEEERMLLTGNPVREIFYQMDREEKRRELGPGDQKILFSLGGSGGSRNLNRFVVWAAPLLQKYPNWRWIHVSGRDYGAEAQGELEGISGLESHTYLEDLPRYLGAADLVIARSGAITLSEIAAVGVASLLIPSPNVANDHQMANARFFEAAGASHLLLDEGLLEEASLLCLEELMKDDGKRRAMGEKARTLAHPKAAQIIAKEIAGEALP